MRLLITVLILASVGCASPPATAPTATSPYVSEVTNAGDPAEDVICRFENKETTVAAFSPLGDRVLVEIAAAEQETATGIAIATGDDEEEDNSGVVAAVGAGRYNQNGELCPVSVSAGENVMYARRSGIDATLEGKKFKVVSERDCLAKW